MKDYISIEGVENGYFVKFNEYRSGVSREQRRMYAAKSKAELLKILDDYLPDDEEKQDDPIVAAI